MATADPTSFSLAADVLSFPMVLPSATTTVPSAPTRVVTNVARSRSAAATDMPTEPVVKANLRVQPVLVLRPTMPPSPPNFDHVVMSTVSHVPPVMPTFVDHVNSGQSGELVLRAAVAANGTENDASAGPVEKTMAIENVHKTKKTATLRSVPLSYTATVFATMLQLSATGSVKDATLSTPTTVKNVTPLKPLAEQLQRIHSASAQPLAVMPLKT